MKGSYDPLLVAFSVALAVLASFTALTLAGRVVAAQGRARLGWLAGGSLAMGVGIWSMHFVGMLAYHLPAPMAYDVPLWLLSVVAAVAASALALAVASRERVGPRALALGGLLMGAGIAGMHYLGMAAMRVPARISYDPALAALSVAIAVGAAVAALWLSFRLRDDGVRHRQPVRWAAAGVMGIAIVGMHYTAMAAARFSAPHPSLLLHSDWILPTHDVAGSVVVATLLILGLALIGAIVDRRMQQKTEEAVALRRSEGRFRALVDATSQIVWRTPPSGDFADEQPQWAAFTGQAPEEYRGWGWINAIHPADRAATATAWNQALATRSPYEVEVRVRRRDGEYRHMLVRGVPVLNDEDGSIREWVGVHADITARKRGENANRFLAEAGRVLASSLDYETTLQSVAELAVPELADWCAIDILGDDHRVRRLAVAHPDPARARLARELDERYPPDPNAAHGVPHVLRTGEPELVPEIPDALLMATTADAEHLRIVRELGLKSYLVVPLQARGRMVGALSLVAAESGRRFTEADVALAQEVARRAAVAIDNARLFRQTEEARLQLEEQATELEAQAVELEEAQAEMEISNEELQHTNEELLRRSEELERARVDAEAANRAKSEFLATMSHELRTPLNAIAGYTELLELGVRGPITDAQREDLRRIQRNQKHLLALINDILNFAKIEAGQVQFDIEDVPLDAMLSAMEPLVEPQLRTKQLTYDYRHGDAALTARADGDRVEQIVLNLLTNAIKFTDAGGRIVLSWEAGTDDVRIHVTDTGRGIAPEKVDAIFEPFVQVEPALTRENEGAGLGLAISRDLARHMGGELSVQSELGRGSTFTLRLPRGAAAAVPRRSAVA